jgi:hemolysin III
MPKRPQTPHEETANAISHGLGIVFCLAAMPFALTKAYAQGSFVAVLAFAIGMLLVYTSSTLYHWVSTPTRKAVLKKMDHISIYFLIAGTYTPFFTFYLDRSTSSFLLSVMWTVVVLGTVYKLFFINRFKWVSIALYLIMGWTALFVIRPLAASMPQEVFALGIGGGICYTTGVFFYVNSNRPYFHTVWHVFVLGGTVIHFMAVYLTVA